MRWASLGLSIPWMICNFFSIIRYLGMFLETRFKNLCLTWMTQSPSNYTSYAYFTRNWIHLGWGWFRGKDIREVDGSHQTDSSGFLRGCHCSYSSAWRDTRLELSWQLHPYLVVYCWLVRPRVDLFLYFWVCVQWRIQQRMGSAHEHSVPDSPLWRMDEFGLGRIHTQFVDRGNFKR